MSTNIDELLKADEEALKAKKDRLKGLARVLLEARKSANDVRESAQLVLEHDGLSRSDLARTFDLTAAEKRAFLPAQRSPKKHSDSPSDHASEELGI